MPHAPKWIIIVSTPRSGTTQACWLIGAHKHARKFAEPFNAGYPSYLEADVLAKFRVATGLKLKTFADQALGEWVRQHPTQTLDVLEGSSAGLQVACFKLFAGELSPEEFKKHLADRPNAHFLFIERSPIDSFISFSKAKQADVWLRSDTTDKRIAIDVERFCEWHAKHREWLQTARQIVAQSGKPFAEMNYERDFLGGERETLERLYQALSPMGISLELTARARILSTGTRLLNRVAQMFGIAPVAKRTLGLAKQDLAPDRASKVSNWDEFIAELAQLPQGMAMLESYLLDSDDVSPEMTKASAKI